MSASVGLAIQCVGILLVALLSMSIRGSIESAAWMLDARLDQLIVRACEFVHRLSHGAGAQSVLFPTP